MDNKKESLVKLNLRGQEFLLNKSAYSVDKMSKLSSVITSKGSGDMQPGSQIYLDRNPALFQYILDYYSQGTMHYPQWACAQLVKEELIFWELEDKVLAPCCWHRYHSELEDNETLADVRTLLNTRDNKLSAATCKERLYRFLTQPHHSRAARIWSGLMLLLIVVSVFSFMLETLPICRVFIRLEYEQEFQNITNRRNIYLLMNSRPINGLVFLEILTTLLLTVELLMKFFSAPKKCGYCKQVSAVADILGVVPVWMVIILTILRANPHLNLEDSKAFKVAFLIFNCFRLFRIFRFVHVLTHMKTLMLFYLALKASGKALVLLLILLLIYATIAANIIYFAEIHLDNFPSIFEGVWWAYITMTTVGYGDFYPVGVAGCIVGIFCATTGILVIAMPVPVIVNNFSALYDSSIKVKREERHSQNRNEKSREVTCKENQVTPTTAWKTSPQ